MMAREQPRRGENQRKARERVDVQARDGRGVKLYKPESVRSEVIQNTVPNSRRHLLWCAVWVACGSSAALHAIRTRSFVDGVSPFEYIPTLVERAIGARRQTVGSDIREPSSGVAAVRGVACVCRREHAVGL